MRARINERFISSLTPPTEGRVEVWDNRDPGFLVRSWRSGEKNKKIFYAGFVSPITGQGRRVKIGEFPSLKVAEAREQARGLLAKVRLEKRDPFLEAQVGRPSTRTRAATVEEAFEDYLKTPDHKAKKSALQIEQIVRRDALPTIGGIAITDVRSADIRQVRDLKAQTGALVSANRLLQALGPFFKYLAEEELIDQSPVLGVRRAIKHEPSRDRVLDDAELVALWCAAASLPPTDCAYIRLLVLLGQRAGETRRMRWEDFDPNERLWRIPAAQTKTGVEQLIPLPALAIEILTSVPRLEQPDSRETCEFVFSKDGVGPMAQQSATKGKLDGLLSGKVEGWRLHDLRRTMRTGLARLKVQPDVAELLLNHNHGRDKIRSVYDRYSYLDEKREALERWSAHIAAAISTAANKA